MIFIRLLALLIILSSFTFSQTNPWVNIFAGAMIDCQAIEGNYLWIGSVGYLTKLNTLTGEKEMFTTMNSGLPDNWVKSIAIDQQGNKWIGTIGGLAKFDDKNWTIYDTSNSGLPDNRIFSIAIDQQGNKWIGTYKGGLAKFDSQTWTVFNRSNSGLPNTCIRSLSIDEQGNKWIGTADSGIVKFDGQTRTVFRRFNSGLPNDRIFSITIDQQGNKWIGTYWGGLGKYDDETWTIYNNSNSELPNNYVYSIFIDKQGNKWIGTYWGGLAKYDDRTWTIYNTSNSELAVKDIYSIFIDQQGNKWIGTGNGLSVFNEKGVVLTGVNESDRAKVDHYLLEQNFPNPFNPTTKISYSIPKQSFVELIVYDMLGREVKILVNKEQSAGKYSVQLNASSLPSGVYVYSIQAGQYRSAKKLLLLK